MASLITPQFERYVAEQTIARGTVQFDEFIFANIPGLNENNLAQYLTMPTSAQIVHRQAVSQSGVINENAVVYSVTIGTEVGDFDFNFIGLINRSKNLLAVAVQTDTVKKIRNKNAVQGNSITRNMLLEFSGAKALTGINVNANTWQIDFTVRLHGLDEKNRLTNRDLYGRAVFFDDSFLVKRKTGNQFTIQPGTAYVEGVRMDLGAEHHLTANSLPCSIYADVVHHCTVTGEYQTEIKYLTQSKADYLDTANRQHYVQILADIDSQGNVTDRRLLSPFLGMNPLTLDDTTENTKDERGHTHKLPIASLVKKGIVKLFSGYDSDAEDMAATPKAIKGLKVLIDAITRNFGNYIPNSKKSSAVNSNSEETVATSAAVKTAYDKGVDAKNAADNAQRTANDGVSKADAAQRTANDGVSKANAAQTSANQAKSAADAAQHTANDGVSKANAAQTSANQAKSAADAAQSSANAANNNANGRISKTDISHATNGTNKAKVASEFALNELNKKLSTVIRKNYTKTIKGTNASFDNATQKNINLEGETIIHPDGKVEQIIHFKAFRVWWFYFEAKNNSERLAVEIPVPLWTAMPNKITNVTATFSRTESGRSFSFGAEAFEWWPPSWAFERQNNIKDRLWLYTIRHVGNQDEHIDLWVKVEGY